MVFGTCRGLHRLRSHGQLGISPSICPGAAWLTTNAACYHGKLHSQPQQLQRVRSHAVDHASPQKPRIMLIGWLGARRDHLDKCAVLW